MLDSCATENAITSLWESLSCRASLPCDAEGYFCKKGPQQTFPDCKRGYHRFYSRGIVIIQHEETEYAGYCKDISRLGIGFYSPQQLFPGDLLTLLVPGQRPLTAELARCVRISELCYVCGAHFESP